MKDKSFNEEVADIVIGCKEELDDETIKKIYAEIDGKISVIKGRLAVAEKELTESYTQRQKELVEICNKERNNLNELYAEKIKYYK